MAIIDANNYFTGVGTAGYSPTTATDNYAPFTIDTSPLTVPIGSGGASLIGYGGLANANAGRDLGVGGEMWLEVLITAAVAQAANSTSFKLSTDADPAMGSPVVLITSPSFTAAQLIAGFTWRTQLPIGPYEQYIGLDVAILTTAWTAGTVEGKLVTNVQQSDLYQSGFFVS